MSGHAVMHALNLSARMMQELKTQQAGHVFSTQDLQTLLSIQVECCAHLSRYVVVRFQRRDQ